MSLSENETEESAEQAEQDHDQRHHRLCGAVLEVGVSFLSVLLSLQSNNGDHGKDQGVRKSKSH